MQAQMHAEQVVRSCHHSACARCKCSAPQQARHPPTHRPGALIDGQVSPAHNRLEAHLPAEGGGGGGAVDRSMSGISQPWTTHDHTRPHMTTPRQHGAACRTPYTTTQTTPCCSRHHQQSKVVSTAPHATAHTTAPPGRLSFFTGRLQNPRSHTSGQGHARASPAPPSITHSLTTSENMTGPVSDR
jgi:hypothetical protein